MSNQTFSNVDKSDSNTHKQTDFNLPKHRGFKIAFLNIASLPKHIDELRLNMQHQYLDILVLNETRLDETISNSEISINKYTLVRNDRTRHGGGVAMYIRNSINFNLRNDLHDEALEFLCVEISKPKVRLNDSNPDKLISVLNDDLKTLQKWLNLNKLSLNAIKTKCMFMASRQKLSTIPEEPNIAISGNKIERVRSYKCLGLKLDESLTWEHHVSTIISKVSKVIGVLRRLKPLLPQSTLTMIYNSLAQPYFDYCSIVWDSLGKGLGQKLQRLQNRAARIITESDYNIRSSDILTSLNWTNLETRRTQQFKTFMYKTVNNMVPSYLSGKFTSTSMIHEHSLRGSNHKLFVPRPLTESLKKSFSYRGATLWNDIPVELTSVQSLAEFKSKIS